jgi:hypothetical protein
VALPGGHYLVHTRRCKLVSFDLDDLMSNTQVSAIGTFSALALFEFHRLKVIGIKMCICSAFPEANKSTSDSSRSSNMILLVARKTHDLVSWAFINLTPTLITTHHLTLVVYLTGLRVFITSKSIRPNGIFLVVSPCCPNIHQQQARLEFGPKIR